MRASDPDPRLAPAAAPAARRSGRPLPATLLALAALACGGSEAADPAADAEPGEAPVDPAPEAAPAPEEAAADAAAGGGHDHEVEEGLAMLRCTADHHDFGEVWQGTAASHEFRLTVVGESPLEIADYRSDCGCTVAHLEVVEPDGSRRAYEPKTPLEPGTEIAVGATFDTAGREGRQSKNVRIFGNLPGGVRELTISADIKKLLEVRPPTGVVESMSVLDRRELEFTVTGTGDEPFALTPLREGLPEEVEVEATPVEPDAEGRAEAWDVRVVLKPGMPRGIRSYTVRLETDLVNESSPRDAEGRPLPFVAEARVSAVVEGLVAVRPQNLNFGMVAADQTVARTVTLTSNDPDFELPEPTWRVEPYKEGASVAFADTLHVTTRPAEGGGWAVELLLEGLGPDVPRSFLGRLVLETGHPDEPERAVVLSGLKRGR